MSIMTARLCFFRSIRWILIPLLVSLFLPLPGFAAGELVLGYVPGECQLFNSAEQAEELAAYLSRQTGRSIRARSFKDEKNLHHWLNRFREVDLAVLSRDYIADNGKGSFIPLAEYRLPAGEELGKAMVVGRRGLHGAVFVQVKQALLNTATDSAAGELLDLLQIAGFVVPRQPQVDYTRTRFKPKNKPILAQQIKPSAETAQPPQEVVAEKTPPAAPIQIEVLSPKDGGMTGPQPLLQYYLKNARAKLLLNGRPLNKGPGDRLGPLKDGRHELLFQLSSPVEPARTHRVVFVVDATPPDLKIHQPQQEISQASVEVGGSREQGAGIRVLDPSGEEVGKVTFPDSRSWLVKLSGLQRGENRYQVVARDSYGNEQRRPLVLQWDTQPPAVAIIAPVDGSVVTGAPALAFSAEEGQVEVLVDGHPVQDVNLALDGLDDGRHVVLVRVRDAAGNLGEARSEFSLDRSGPGLTVEPVEPSLNKRQTVLQGQREEDSVLAVSLEPAELSAQLSYPDSSSWQLVLDGLQEGRNLVILQASDAAGNLTTEEITLRVDMTAPVVKIASPESHSVHSTSPVLDYETEDGLVQVLLDGVELALPSGTSLPVMTEGEHTLVVTSTDEAGNAGLARAVFVVDRTAPQLELVSPAEGLSRDAEPLLEVRGEHSFSVYLDGRELQIVSGEPLPRMDDGEHQLTLVAVDEGGNRLEIERKLLIDTIPPGWEVLSGLEPTSLKRSELAGRRDADVTLNFSSETVTLSPVDYPTPESWAVSLSDLAEGENRVQVSATDPAGNTRSGDVVLLVDSKPPELVVDSPLADEVYPGPPELAYHVDEGDVLLKLDSEPLQLENGSPLPALEDGQHLLLIQVNDQVGNQTVQVVPFSVDRQGPRLTVTSLPAVLSDRLLQLTGSSDPDARVKVVDLSDDAVCEVVRDEAGGWTCAAGPFEEGALSLEVVAVDPAGNESRQLLTTRVDLTPPSLDWRSPGPGTYQQLPAFDYVIGEGELSLLLDEKELPLDVNPSTLDLDDGLHRLDMVVTDAAGHQSHKSIVFTIDRQAPIVILTQPEERVAESQPRLSFVSNEGQVKVLLDGELLEIDAGDTLPALDDGDYTIRVEAVDEAGNLGFAERSFRVDTKGPHLELLDAPELVRDEQTVLSGVADPDAALSATVHGQAVPVERLADGGWQLPLEGLINGSNPVVLLATDPAGLQTELQIDVVRDNRPPELDITSPQQGQVYAELPRFDFSAGEGAVAIQLDAQPTELVAGEVLPPLDDGEHQLEVEVVDRAGNRASKLVTFILDRQGPALDVNSLPTSYRGEFLLLQGMTEQGLEVRVLSEGAEVCNATSAPDGTWSCSLGPFEEGSLHYTVAVSDSAGNETHREVSSFIDRTPPVLDWRAPLPGRHGQVKTFDYTLSDGELEILIDGQRYDPADPLPAFADGLHTLEISAVDSAGNQVRRQIELSIDLQAPLVVITQPESLVTDAQPVLSFVADEADTTIFLNDQQLEIEAGDRLPQLDDGDHLLRIEARDDLGNLAVAERVFRVDTARPELLLSSEPRPVVEQSVILKGQVDAEAVVTAEFEGRELLVERSSSEEWSLVVDGLKEGTNQVVVKATKPSGLQSGLNIQVVRDSTAPALAVTSPLEQTYAVDSVKLEYQTDVEPGQVEIELDGQQVDPAAGGLLGPLSDGEHHLVVRALDAAGNRMQFERSFAIDTTPPAFFVDPLPDSIPSATILLSGTREPGSFIDVLPPDGATATLPHYPAENLWEIELGSVPEGQHELHFTARDRFGNTGFQKVELNVDSLEPKVRILSPVAGSFNDPRPELRVEGEGGEVTALLNGEPIQIDIDRFSNLSDGDYVLLVTERDAAGNVGQARVEFSVDTTPPEVELISPAKGDRTSTMPTLAYKVAGGDVQIQLDGQDIEVESGARLPQLGEGDHVVRLTAVDEAGNVGTAQASFTVDGSAPQVILLAPASGLTPDSTPLLQFRVDRGEVRVLVDGQEVDKRSGSFLDSLEEGEHVVRVEAVDEVGNIGFAERRLIVSLAEPEVFGSSDLSDRFAGFGLDVSPSRVQLGYSDDIELRIGPLRRPGETVYIEQWVDTNGNGVADSGEEVARVFKLVDGLASPSRKVPGDADGTADRFILLRLSLDQLHQGHFGPAQYVLLAMGESDVSETVFQVVE